MANFGDAAIMLVLILLLLFGVDVRIVFIIFLIGEMISSIAKAFGAALEPVVDTLKRLKE